MLTLALWATAPEAVAADPFYKGKTIHLILSAGEGGGYAAYGQPLAAHLGDHLEGRPTVIVQHMTGAGGIRATNYLFAEAPRDGTYIGLVHSSAPFAPLFGTKAARFDARKFNWLGSMNAAPGICIAWHDAPIKTWNDMLTKEFIVGSSGAGSQMSVLPSLLNRAFGTRIKIVAGYKDGDEVFLAMEKGEVQGRCGTLISSMHANRPDWIPQKKVAVTVVLGPERLADFPGVPSVMEFAKDEATRQQFELTFGIDAMDRPVLAPPDVPAERVAELRQAFVATMRDPAFRADAERERIEVDFLDGAEVAATLGRVYDLPAPVIAQARQLMAGNGPGE